MLKKLMISLLVIGVAIAYSSGCSRRSGEESRAAAEFSPTGGDSTSPQTESGPNIDFIDSSMNGSNSIRALLVPSAQPSLELPDTAENIPVPEGPLGFVGAAESRPFPHASLPPGASPAIGIESFQAALEAVNSLPAPGTLPVPEKNSESSFVPEAESPLLSPRIGSDS